jgi:peptide deformylase
MKPMTETESAELQDYLTEDRETLTLSIVKWPDEILTQVCDPVTKFNDELAEKTRAMVRFLAEQSTGIGIAAPQLGLKECIILVNIDDAHKVPTVMVNPRLIATEGPMVPYKEGCLSMPGVYNQVLRQETVSVGWQGVKGETYSCQLFGLNARIFQHELDHLVGAMFFDRMPRNLKRAVLREWDKK